MNSTHCILASRGWLGLALASALALASPSVIAQPTVDYARLSTPNPDPNFPWDFQGMRLMRTVPQSYGLDFNNDGTLEYIIRASGFSSPHSFGIYAQGQNSVWVQPTFDTSFAAALTEGVEVGANLSSPSYLWENSSEGAIFSASIDTYVLGNSAFEDSTFCGLRFDLDGETHYGWVRIGAPLPVFNGGWIYDYAYDTRPGAAILTMVPEPATWAFALGGAAAWLCLRRRPSAK